MAAVASSSTTTKMSWRLQEFVAHSSIVSCLVLGKSSGRLLATGGEDGRVNFFSVSKPNCVMSLTGHSNPVECVQFNGSEEQIVAGSQSGSLRVWDLEAAKILRTLAGHKANISSLDFHPFGDYLASGSMDTNICMWDLRSKGCVFRYKGHTQVVRCVAFSPDGKWLASASDDSTIKLWDLTAGKVITEFTAHTGPVNIVQFHPTEYLLASGSSDRTIKMWDLEKFSMIGSSTGETGPVRCVLFNPDGCCLYSGSVDSLHVYGWEPDCCFDAVPVGWGKVADLSICNNQLIGVSHQLTSVSSYVVDLTRVKKSGCSETKGHVQDNQPITEPSPKGSTLRRSYERPTTTCSSQSRVKEARQERWSPEGEHRSPSSEDEKEEKESTAEIQNAEDYKEIFQPKAAISRTPPKFSEPFPAPLEEDRFVVRASQVSDVMTPMPDKQQPGHLRDIPMASTAEIQNAEDYKEIFQPKAAISRTPHKFSEPFPAPLEEDRFVVRASQVSDVMTPMPDKQQPGHLRDIPMASTAEIQNAEDYKEIFQPKAAISRTPHKFSEPFPAPLEEDRFVVRASQVSDVMTPMPDKQQPGHLRDIPMASTAEIQNAEDYKEIFQPKAAISRTPHKFSEPFPAPLEEDRFVVRASQVSDVMTPMPDKQQPGHLRDIPMASTAEIQNAEDYKEIFQPKAAISRTPHKFSEPFPAPLEEDRFVVRASQVSDVMTPMPDKQQPGHLRDIPMASTAEIQNAEDYKEIFQPKAAISRTPHKFSEPFPAPLEEDRFVVRASQVSDVMTPMPDKQQPGHLRDIPMASTAEIQNAEDYKEIFQPKAAISRTPHKFSEPFPAPLEEDRFVVRASQVSDVMTPMPDKQQPGHLRDIPMASTAEIQNAEDYKEIFQPKAAISRTPHKFSEPFPAPLEEDRFVVRASQVSDVMTPMPDKQQPGHLRDIPMASTAEIQNAEDYKEIFQPKAAISRTPHKFSEPFPAPLEEDRFVVRASQVSDVMTPMPDKQQPGHLRDIPMASTAEIQNAEDYKEIFQPKAAISRTPHKFSEPFPAPLEEDRFVVRASQVSDVMTPMPDKQQPGHLRDIPMASTAEIQNAEDYKEIFQPKAAISRTPHKFSEPFPAPLEEDRFVVRASQVSDVMTPMPDKQQTGYLSLKLVLKHFWPLISDTLKAPPSVGVDLTREERHEKCKACHKQLKNLSNVVKNKADQVGRHGSTFKELQLLLSPVDY